MRIAVVFLCLMLFVNLSFGQGSAKPVYFNEASISVNRTLVGNSNTTDLFGCGVGLSRVIFNRRSFFLNAGLEYNFTRQKKDRTYEGRFAHAENVTYDLHFLTIPLTVRYDMGHKVRFFVETGVFIDLMLYSWWRGTWYSYLPGSGGMLAYNSKFFEGNAGVSNPNYGILAGLGIRIPVEGKGYVVVKSDYRFGFNVISEDDDILNRYVRLALGWNGLFCRSQPK